MHTLLVRLKLIMFKWLSPRHLQRETWFELVMMVLKTSRSNVIIAEKHVIIGSYEKPIHCVKIVQIRSFFWSVFSCIWTEKTPYLDTFHSYQILMETTQTAKASIGQTTKNRNNYSYLLSNNKPRTCV